MFARLWWKEMRLFWPIWVLLVVVASGVQLVLLQTRVDHVHEGVLALLAGLYAALYAVAVGSAAFAGERETGTLDLLDALPVPRRLLWGSKVSFAFASTLGLTLVLLAIAAAGTTSWKLPAGEHPTWIAAGCAALLVEAVAWGLFWSSRTRNALAAAVLTLACLFVATPLIVGLVAIVARAMGLPLPLVVRSADFFVDSIPWRLGVSALAVLTSAPAIVWPIRPSRVLRMPRLRFRSPVVVAASEAQQIGAVRYRQPLRPEIRALIWQTLREGSSIWWILAVIGVLAGLRPEQGAGPLTVWSAYFFNAMVVVISGVSAFNLSSRHGILRFLAHHGARPGVVWGVKLTMWAFGLVLIWLVAWYVWPEPSRLARSAASWQLWFLILFASYTIGTVCGMAFPRGITAAVVAMLLNVLLLFALMPFLMLGMVSQVGLFTGVAGLVLVTWFWRADWLFERPALGRYLRLGLMLLAVAAVSPAVWVADRAWGVPDAPALPAPTNVSQLEPETSNARELYRQAALRLVSGIPADLHNPAWIDAPASPEFQARARIVELERPVIELVRQASQRPFCRFPASLTEFDSLRVFRFPDLARLVQLEAMIRQQRGDLAGAWDDLMVLFRMSRHFAAGPTTELARFSLTTERAALGQALEWSVAPGQTAQQLHAAEEAYRAIVPGSGAVDFVKAQAQLIERTLSEPQAELRADLLRASRAETRGVTGPADLEVKLLPWEVARARRACRLVLGSALVQATREPWQRDYVQPETQLLIKGGRRGEPSTDPVPPATIVGPYPQFDFAFLMPPGVVMQPGAIEAIESTVLARELLPDVWDYLVQDEWNEVGRRVLPFYLAIRAWQVEHGGQMPQHEDLEKDLNAWPTDPYSGEPFRYRIVEGSPIDVRRLGEVFEITTPVPGTHFERLARRAVVYSVGPDRRDERASFSYPGYPVSNGRGDFIFPLPPAPSAKGPSKPAAP